MMEPVLLNFVKYSIELFVEFDGTIPAHGRVAINSTQISAKGCLVRPKG